MKTEFERISEIMYTLLEHQPVIDVPYEKINDIAIALVKEGYGKVSEYKTEIEQLKAENEHRKKQYDNQLAENTRLHIEYDKAFERLKAQQREIDRLKANINQAQDQILETAQKNQEYREQQVKQSQIDVLNRVMTYINDKIENDYGDMSDSVKYLTINIDDFDDFIDELIKEVENETK